MTAPDKLLCCPFCHSERVKIIDTGQQAFGACENDACQATGPQARGQDRAERAGVLWDTRD